MNTKLLLAVAVASIGFATAASAADLAGAQLHQGA